jgi:hypothetical protein
LLAGAVEHADDFQRVSLGTKDNCARQARHRPFTCAWLPTYPTDVWKIAEKIETRSEAPANGFRGQRSITGYMRFDVSKM